MTTAQDQQSRAEFEAHMRKLSPCVRLYRHTCDGGDKYRTVTVQRNWELWQAARALPAGMEPLCYLRPAAATTPARAWQAWENDGTAQPVYTAAQVLAMLAQGLAPGWQAVPVVPSGDMLVAIMSVGEVDVLRETPEMHQVLLIDRAGIPERYANLLAAAPQPPAAPATTEPQTPTTGAASATAGAAPAYRLLVRDVDIIQADDEFLRDADSTWQIDPQGIFVGMAYMSNVLLPARRAIEPTP